MKKTAAKYFFMVKIAQMIVSKIPALKE
jgi:hypothetical protein